MTRNEMHEKIAIKLQKINSFAFDNFEPEEYDSILNDAQLDLIKQRLNFRSDPKQAGFPKNQKRLNDLRTIVKTAALEIDSRNPPTEGEVYPFSLPEDFFLEFQTECTEQAAGKPQEKIPVRVIENDRFWEDMMNPFRRPIRNSLPGYIEDDSLVIKPHERYIIVGARLTYIRLPQEIGVSSNCELPEHTHSEIVDLAVAQLLEIIESRRYQSSKIEASQSE